MNNVIKKTDIETHKKFVIYISGKITGTTDYVKRFMKRELELRKEYPNAEIINPANMNHVMPISSTWNDYMRMCYMLLDMADALSQLPDWKESPGACCEYGYSIAKNLYIL